MSNILYLDCFSGISGDMIVGALLGLGVDFEYLEQELKKIDVSGYEISFKPVLKNGISGNKFSCVLTKHDHAHRTFKDIKEIILNSSLNDNIKKRAVEIFQVIAEAESKVHGISVEKVHFHEVGAVDSIIDIVSIAVLLDYLKIEQIYSSRVPLGSGFIDSAHGRLPVPVPAVIEILRDVPCYDSGLKGEIVTPTGAGVLKYLVCEYKRPDMVIDISSYGAGDKDFEIPNLLRVFLGKKSKSLYEHDNVCVLETNIDDEKGNVLGYVFKKLLNAGALDVYYESIYMKKNRPAYKLCVICSMDKKDIFSDIILKETSSFGVRVNVCDRIKLKREIKTIALDKKFDIRVKAGYDNNGNCIKVVPEYEDCVKYAEAMNLSLADVYAKLNDQS